MTVILLYQYKWYHWHDRLSLEPKWQIIQNITELTNVSESLNGHLLKRWLKTSKCWAFQIHSQCHLLMLQVQCTRFSCFIHSSVSWKIPVVKKILAENVFLFSNDLTARVNFVVLLSKNWNSAVYETVNNPTGKDIIFTTVPRQV